MSNFEWKILDHRWNNFKRWFEAMENKKDKPYVKITALRSMIDYIDTFDDKITDASIILKMMED